MSRGVQGGCLKKMMYIQVHIFQKKQYNPRINVYNTIFSMNNIVDIYFEGKRQPLVADVVN